MIAASSRYCAVNSKEAGPGSAAGAARDPAPARAGMDPMCREWFERGKRALQRRNWRLAVFLSQQVLEKAPDWTECRQVLRAARTKQLEEEKPGLFLQAWFRLRHQALLTKARLLQCKDPQRTIALAEEVLAADPRHQKAHLLLARAALACQWPETALASLRTLDEICAEDDVDSRIFMAEALAEAGEADRAEALLNQLARRFPESQKVVRSLKALLVSNTMPQCGQQLPPAEVTSGHSSQSKGMEPNPGQSEGEQSEKPKAHHLLLELERLVQEKNFSCAEERYFIFVRAPEHKDASLERAAARLVLQAYDSALAELSAGQANGLADELESARKQFLLSSLEEHCRKYPQDMQACHDLGQAHFQAGEIPQAIRCFQQSLAKPVLRRPSQMMLGKCFRQRGLHDLAIRAFQQAMADSNVRHQDHKELLYELGRAFQAANQPEAALEHYQTLCQLDFGFQDAAERLEQIGAHCGSRG
jgi:tetratricopeptide (TPR) repeat protein